MPTPRGHDGQSRVRLQRVLADAGIAARRVCERLIEEGHVKVNGEVVTRLPIFVDPDNDHIEVDGRGVRKPERRVYLMLNKPGGTLVTAADEPGLERPTVLNLVNHPAAPRLFPVGRLDLDTTGLVLLTNDGDLANRLTHPRYGVPKTYHVLVKGELQDEDIAAIGIKMRAVAQREAVAAGLSPRSTPAPEVVILRREEGKTLLEITLKEAVNRQLREVLRVLGIPVKKLARVAIGPIRLRGLAVGHWRELTREELMDLRHISEGPAARPRARRRVPAAARPQRLRKAGQRSADNPKRPRARRPSRGPRP